MGNLTLTGYNTTYSDRDFDEKKTIEGGFADSSVRLNKFVREQTVWTPKEMTTRTNELVKRALKAWPPLRVDKTLVDAADHSEMRKLAARQDLTKIRMTADAKALYEALRAQVMTIGTDILELAEPNSISYHGPAFFLEVLPRAHKLTLLLALDFNEVDDPSGLAKDATEKKFFVHASHEGGVSMSIWDSDAIEKALPVIRQAYAASNE